MWITWGQGEVQQDYLQYPCICIPTRLSDKILRALSAKSQLAWGACPTSGRGLVVHVLAGREASPVVAGASRANALLDLSTVYIRSPRL